MFSLILTADEFKQKYRMNREALLVIAERIKDDDVFKNKRGPKQMNPTHKQMVLLGYLGTAGSGANNPKQRAYFHVGNGSVNNSRKWARDAVIHSLGIFIIGLMKMRGRTHPTVTRWSSTFQTVWE